MVDCISCFQVRSYCYSCKGPYLLMQQICMCKGPPRKYWREGGLGINHLPGSINHCSNNTQQSGNLNIFNSATLWHIFIGPTFRIQNYTEILHVYRRRVRIAIQFQFQFHNWNWNWSLSEKWKWPLELVKLFNSAINSTHQIHYNKLVCKDHHDCFWRYIIFIRITSYNIHNYMMKYCNIHFN